jgi:hypothetical protein
MKKLVKEVVVAGLALFLAHTVYGLASSVVAVNVLPDAVALGVVGYLTVRLADIFRK